MCIEGAGEMGAGSSETPAVPATSSSSSNPSCSISAPAAAGASPSGGKRSRDPEEEIYLDNLHSHKRYLSEIMASSLNGLSVGDTLDVDNLMESPARSEGLCYCRDDMGLQYSPMSEDSDDYRYCDTPSSYTILQSDFTSNLSSPVSPHRLQSSFWGSCTANQYPLPSCNLSAVVCSHTRQRGGSESEGRFPSSPNDMCHTTDLRRAALLRSVQMRTQPHCPPAYELQFSNRQEDMHNTEEGGDRSLSCIKGIDEDTGYQSADNDAEYINDCSSVDGNLDSKPEAI